MKKFFLINLSIICLVVFLLPGISKAQDLTQYPEACRNIEDSARRSQCKKCVDTDKGTWLKVPIPVIFNKKGMPPPYCDQSGTTLRHVTCNGRCIHNPAILLFMIYYLALLLMALTAVFMLILGGYQYIYSFGNAELVKDAKTKMYYAVGGLMLGLSSYILLGFINPDLTGFRWSSSLLQRDVSKALEDIKKGDETKQDKCPEKTEAVSGCKNKAINDFCKNSSGEEGTCELDPGIEGCTCNIDPCVNNCNNNNAACEGKKCKDSGGGIEDGKCVKDAAGKIDCKDMNSVCGAGDCGGAFAKDWDQLNCFGEYNCTTSDGKAGFCLNTSPGTGDYGKSLCQSFETLCLEDCGAAFADYFGDQKLTTQCHGKRYCDAGGDATADVCFRGGCFSYDPSEVMCAHSGDIGKACGSAGSYGVCAIYPPDHPQEGLPYCETAFE